MRIALCPFNATVGAVATNAREIVRACSGIADADLHVFPELSLCGYPPKDLLLQRGFVDQCVREFLALDGVLPPGARLVVGLPAPREHGIANSLGLRLTRGDLREYDKRLLPTYDVFDEDRYFTPGISPMVVDIKGVRVGFAICEDLWRGHDAGFASRYSHAPDPVAELVRAGAQVIISPSASPFVLGKNHRHRDIVRDHAMRHGIIVASVNQFGGNDELVFDGHAFAYGPGGELLVDGGTFSGSPVILDTDIVRPAAAISREPEHDLFDALTLGVRDYIRKTGFKSALLGLSGGIDSALTAALAVHAIGHEHVRGVAMPSRYSSDHSIEDALALAANLGIPCHVATIQDAVNASGQMADKLFDAIGTPRLGATLPDLAEENLQSRVRGTLLMTLSNRTGSIVLTTGNKSEMAVGYCTLYGDMNGGLAVLSDVSKMWVYRLSRWINANYSRLGFGKAPIPERSIDKAPSAELRPDQTDQDSLPPYAVLDAIIERYIEHHEAPDRIVAAGFDEATVRRVVRMIDLSEYKRKQAAIGLKVTSVAFGSGRRWPIAWKREA